VCGDDGRKRLADHRKKYCWAELIIICVVLFLSGPQLCFGTVTSSLGRGYLFNVFLFVVKEAFVSWINMEKTFPLECGAYQKMFSFLL
jgi:hypothetical protein